MEIQWTININCVLVELLTVTKLDCVKWIWYGMQLSWVETHNWLSQRTIKCLDFVDTPLILSGISICVGCFGRLFVFVGMEWKWSWFEYNVVVMRRELKELQRWRISSRTDGWSLPNVLEFLVAWMEFEGDCVMVPSEWVCILSQYRWLCVSIRINNQRAPGRAP